ncbi:M23 family metallopeptidase [Phytoactinopolyspora mesophila]|uniref:Peptidoglycan DD-metalloendopeptidase family protein n=1 Tax=Phytoactinopolyspora mesophila TaxID=2650750 RepID=A0A7K3M115_9ACTN|nr:M23 family metallopeptidase [Phytoactinopolyspora mesophila]NDL56991.1 peptidoglycan DD-metalloendopeptidase family protein [Phytoactinopolyspora mesophila]
MLGRTIAGLALISAAFLFTGTLGATVVLGDAGNDGTDDHGYGTFCAASTVDGLNTEQTEIARTIIKAGDTVNVPHRGLVVALAAGAVETRLRNLPYGDRDSLGVFQQRPSTGWGTPNELMNVSYASAAFFGGPDGPNSQGAVSEPPGLLDIHGWEQMTVGQAAQAVQRSAFPDRYADWEDDARAWVAELAGDGSNCAASLPIAKGRYRITDRYGYREHPITGEWKLHDGLDFAAPTGTPVVAIAPGEVTFVGFRPWAGPHLVEIDHGDGHTSEYGHMSSAGVARHDTVGAGQQIGTVGNEGLSTGPHLHLTIRHDGETLDPERWFADLGVQP